MTTTTLANSGSLALGEALKRARSTSFAIYFASSWYLERACIAGNLSAKLDDH